MRLYQKGDVGLLKKITTNTKKLLIKLLAIILCFSGFISVSPKATYTHGAEVTNVIQTRNEKDIQNGKSNLETSSDGEKIENQAKKSEEGKWRKVGRFLGRRGFYFLLGMIAPHFNVSQDDLKYAESLTIGYIIWKFSGDVCSLVGLKDKKTREYALKNIGKKAANLLIRLGSMVAMNKAVPKNILCDYSMGYICDSVDIVFEDMTPEDRQNIKNAANRGATLSEEGIRYCCFSYLAKFIPKLLGC